ncbi:binding-protein-dependent transport systems inner membrane component [Candidatus Moduliflexus flocculans]|uniref:Binding-protein-dependent transport systems inner membrane component n=1 Tax=Candidatus Moduliflexus flocculans TaxID=1499966 RepID=A0A0S6VPL1_9BACT|nr:binding-protein-dependent transport systems inner membrane component [Candidatus Moduliflexus flocculans]
MMTRIFRKQLSLQRKQALWGWLLISPWLVGMLAFTIFPMIASLAMSFFQVSFNPEAVSSVRLTEDGLQTLEQQGVSVEKLRPLLNQKFPSKDALFETLTTTSGTLEKSAKDAIWNAARKSYFVGATNWKRLLADSELLPALGRTLQIGAMIVPGTLLLAVAFAALLHSEHLKGSRMFRCLFYLPAILPIAATSRIIFGLLYGWVNYALAQWFGIKTMGINGVSWFDNVNLIYYPLALINIWGVGPTMLIVLAGLQNIPTELYDAAYVDGAGWWRRFAHITLPMLSPALFYCVVIAMMGMMQYFAVPFALAGNASGAPGGATSFIMIYFIRHLQYGNYGYSSALAWLILLISCAIALLLFGTRKFWVYYANEG